MTNDNRVEPPTLDKRFANCLKQARLLHGHLYVAVCVFSRYLLRQNWLENARKSYNWMENGYAKKYNIKRVVNFLNMKCEWPVLTRCCFCLPLRRGLLAIGYVKFIYSAFMLGIYSYAIHIGVESTTLFLHGATEDVAAEFCLILYILELVASAVMLHGAHKKLPFYLRGCFYYGLASTVAIICAKLVEFADEHEMFIGQLELLGFCFTGIFIQFYMLTVLWNLVKKLEKSGCHQFENPLQHFV